MIAFVLLFGALPMNNIYDELSNMEFTSIKAYAVTPEEFTHADDDNGDFTVTIAPSQLAAYSQQCQIYDDYHQSDKLVISSMGGESSSRFFVEGFEGIGTEDCPFGGSVSIDMNNSIVLNLDAPLFNYVYDSATINNNGNAFEISREYSQDEKDALDETHMDTTPLLAKYVKHDDSNSNATWNIKVVHPTAGEDPYLGNFGGFIGSMCDSAVLDLNITMNKVDANDNISPKILGYNTDLGLICGTMEENSSLNVSLSATRNIQIIDNSGGSESEMGHVGGIVGKMGFGSTLNYTGTNIQTSATQIKTSVSERYAGGIVGYNDGGTVKITLPSGVSAYPITQYIQGTAGAGGIYGYYKPAAPIEGDGLTSEETEKNNLNSMLDTNNFSINCQVNGGGYDGGLFGVLESEYDYSISGTGTVTSKHNTGSAVGYGGLIGRYFSSDLSKTLLIGAVTATPTKTSDASYFGGGIAFVGESMDKDENGRDVTNNGSAYVKFDGFTLSNAAGANAMTFGGLAAKADQAFVDANKPNCVGRF